MREAHFRKWSSPIYLMFNFVCENGFSWGCAFLFHTGCKCLCLSECECVCLWMCVCLYVWVSVSLSICIVFLYSLIKVDTFLFMSVCISVFSAWKVKKIYKCQDLEMSQENFPVRFSRKSISFWERRWDIWWQFVMDIHIKRTNAAHKRFDKKI